MLKSESCHSFLPHPQTLRRTKSEGDFSQLPLKPLLDTWDTKVKTKGLRLTPSTVLPLIKGKKTFFLWFKKFFTSSPEPSLVQKLDLKINKTHEAYARACVAQKLADKECAAEKFIKDFESIFRILRKSVNGDFACNETLSKAQTYAYLDAFLFLRENKAGCLQKIPLRSLITPLSPCLVMGSEEFWPQLALFAAKICLQQIPDEESYEKFFSDFFWSILILTDAASYGDLQAEEFLHTILEKSPPQDIFKRTVAQLALHFLAQNNLNSLTATQKYCSLSTPKTINELFLFTCSEDEKIAQTGFAELLKQNKFKNTYIFCAIALNAFHPQIKKQAFESLNSHCKDSPLSSNYAILTLTQLASKKGDPLQKAAFDFLNFFSHRTYFLQQAQDYLKNTHPRFTCKNLQEAEKIGKTLHQILKIFKINELHQQFALPLYKIVPTCAFLAQHPERPLFKEATWAVRAQIGLAEDNLDISNMRDLTWPALLMQHQWLSQSHLKTQALGLFCGLALYPHSLTLTLKGFALETLREQRLKWLEKNFSAQLVTLVHLLPPLWHIVIDYFNVQFKTLISVVEEEKMRQAILQQKI